MLSLPILELRLDAEVLVPAGQLGAGAAGDQVRRQDVVKQLLGQAVGQGDVHADQEPPAQRVHVLHRQGLCVWGKRQPPGGRDLVQRARVARGQHPRRVRRHEMVHLHAGAAGARHAVLVEAVPRDLKHRAAVLHRVGLHRLEVDVVGQLAHQGAQHAAVQRHQPMLPLLHQLHHVALHQVVHRVLLRAEVVARLAIRRREHIQQDGEVRREADQVRLLAGRLVGRGSVAEERLLQVRLHLHREVLQHVLKAAVLVRCRQDHLGLVPLEEAVRGGEVVCPQLDEALLDAPRHLVQHGAQRPLPVHHRARLRLGAVRDAVAVARSVAAQDAAGLALRHVPVRPEVRQAGRRAELAIHRHVQEGAEVRPARVLPRLAHLEHAGDVAAERGVYGGLVVAAARAAARRLDGLGSLLRGLVRAPSEQGVHVAEALLRLGRHGGVLLGGVAEGSLRHGGDQP
mmetsp:Transcript_7120/g.18244  ORF Transcript_7120/g.18244 Transcript_7120/m.18244 type:complete len:456 (+) Transcript_7120:291-1658(+)